MGQLLTVRRRMSERFIYNLRVVSHRSVFALLSTIFVIKHSFEPCVLWREQVICDVICDVCNGGDGGAVDSNCVMQCFHWVASCTSCSARL